MRELFIVFVFAGAVSALIAGLTSIPRKPVTPAPCPYCAAEKKAHAETAAELQTFKSSLDAGLRIDDNPEL